MAVINVQNFHKSFGLFPAVKGVDLLLHQGELLGLIGPDGAGKTTLIRAICTLLSPDEGRIDVLDKNTVTQAACIRAQIGYMPQRFSLYQDLSVSQNLRFFADLFQVPEAVRQERLARLYDFSKLAPFKNRLAGDLSGGMKQKLALSCALIHTPRVLVLDEPTYGVDPISREEFWEILHMVKQEGTSVLVSTAYMDEADQCDRVALFFEGRIAATGSPAALKDGYPFPLYRLEARNLRNLRDYFKSMALTQSTHLFGDALHVSLEREPHADEWQHWKQDTDWNLQSWNAQSPTIEDVFLNLTRKSS